MPLVGCLNPLYVGVIKDRLTDGWQN